jgi:hypothetical protein
MQASRDRQRVAVRVGTGKVCWLGLSCRTEAAFVAALPAAVNHVLLTEQQLLARLPEPGSLKSAHNAEGLP